MARPLRVLVLEDNPDDAELMIRELRRVGFIPEWQRADCEHGLLAGLAMQPEIILSDYGMPGFDGLQAWAYVRKQQLDIPFIMVSGTIGEDVAVAAMREGIDDYLLKDRLARLGLAVNNALERKRLRDQERRQASQLRLQAAAMEAAANSIVITDRSGAIQWVNPAFTTFTGFAREEVIGRNPRILKSGQHDRQFYENLWQTIQQGRCWQGEVVNRKKDGSTYYAEMTITPVCTDGASATHFIAIQQDVTQRKRLEAEFLQAQKMESFGRLAGGVAHDFNNILTVICGFSDLLLATQPPNGQAHNLVAEIKKAGERAAGLTQQLLAFSRKQIMQPRMLDVNGLVRDVEKMLRRMIGEDVRLAVEQGANLPPVLADPSQIQQVLINLAVNARDAMPDGGTLTIATRVAAAAPSTPGPNRDADAVAIEVTDTGCGMTPEVQAQIFEPFFTTKELGKGTGLGLATVHGIVAQSGGQIEVESQPGRGTTFRILLPRGQEAAVEVRPAEPVESPLLGSETILLVEDDGPVRSLAGLVLRNAGYTVLEAVDGKQALETLGRYSAPIDLMLTDVVLPVKNGRQLAMELEPKSPMTKTLYMSGYLDDTIVRHGIIEGGLAFLQKPFSASSLLSKVRAVLDETRHPERHRPTTEAVPVGAA